MTDFFSLGLRLLGRKPTASQQLNHQLNLDKKLVYSLSKSRVPNLRQLKYIKTYLNKRELLIFRGCLTLITISVIFLGGRFYFKHLESVPSVGGDYTEGVVGLPKYINPLYASISDVDSDLTQLIFSSLFKRDNNGFLTQDLVESYTVTPDGKSYVIKIKPNVRWQNNTPLNADDIVFTFNTIKDVQYKSPLRPSFSGVTISKVDDLTVKFVLNESYAAFFELLTFGILPQSQWSQIPAISANLAGLNLKPIGSGPYELKASSMDKTTGVIKSYTLGINDNYYGDKPHIKTLIFKFYPSYEELIPALNNNSVDGISYLPSQFESVAGNKTYLNYYKLNLPQLNAIFFNQKTNPALADKNIRQALALAINKDEVVSQVLGGNARSIDGPVLPDSFAYDPAIKKYSFNQTEARKLIETAGWKPVQLTAEVFAKAQADTKFVDPATNLDASTIVAMGKGNWYFKGGKFLIIKLTTVDLPENAKVVNAIHNYWEAVGVKVAVELIATDQVQATVIKPRAFEALFYGEMIGADPDPYLFWHSSQANASGLNIANYSDKQVDKLLEDARLTVKLEARKTFYTKFQQIIADAEPAIFMYSPVYTYVQDKKIKNYNTKSIVVPSDRLTDIANWYITLSNKVVW